ncbi:LuxR C-terminal-related transcriptional regulator [Rhodococcus sp. MS13]|uniref:ATP-binding protein n=1 Tax=Rhodococcus sp. MS13 TaxID=2579940 RepID=UPI001561B0AB|nr:LuxR C-terminal-related transcriptional regulator [Rhodococcus sp. MS13]
MATPRIETIGVRMPPELTNFIGRRREIEETRRRMGTSRLVTVTGPGGVGKTRLAYRVAENARRTFRDGIRLIELDGVCGSGTSEDGLQNTNDGRSIDPHFVAWLSDSIGDREILLILDNCEQCIDPISQAAIDLLRACPRLRILATSREPLGLSGEAVIRIAPMTVSYSDQLLNTSRVRSDDAITLFLDRARVNESEFPISDADQSTVAQICQRLDGIPLLIELAAARLRAMSIDQILERLDDRFLLLTLGARGSPGRQQTLTRCIKWSYDLCNDLEKDLWARLAVFTESFTLEAAEAVCSENTPAPAFVDILTGLVDKSIVMREVSAHGVRYRMLGTIREYGRTRSQNFGNLKILQNRHFDWLCALAAQAESKWVGAQQELWVARLSAEESNLRFALTFAFTAQHRHLEGLRLVNALSPYWFARGMFEEGLHWIPLAMATKDSTALQERARALCNASMFLSSSGVPPTEPVLRELRELSDQTDDPTTRGFLNLSKCFIALHMGDLSELSAEYSVASELSLNGCSQIPQVIAGHMLGLLAGRLGDLDTAIALAESTRTIAEELGDTYLRSCALWAEALLAMKNNDFDKATRLFRHSLQLSQCIADPHGYAWSMEGLGWVAAQERRYTAAASLLGAANAMWGRVKACPATIFVISQYHTSCETEVRRSMSSCAFESAFRNGRDLSMRASLAKALGETMPSRAPSEPNSLTKREREVAALVAEGLTNKAIARKLVISQRTAQGHVERILVKLGFTSRTQIATWTVEQSRHSAQ